MEDNPRKYLDEAILQLTKAQQIEGTYAISFEQHVKIDIVKEVIKGILDNLYE